MTGESVSEVLRLRVPEIGLVRRHDLCHPFQVSLVEYRCV